MQQGLASSSLVRHPLRVRRAAFLTVGLCLAALLAGLTFILVQTTFSSAAAPFTPRHLDGLIAEGTVVTLAADDEVPAIARLDPALRDALRQAETDAAHDGVSFRITSGWRSAEYQLGRLLDEAIDLYASEEVARQFVATPDRSAHVAADAVDIAPLEAQLCASSSTAPGTASARPTRTSAGISNLRPRPAGICPPMMADATGTGR